MFYAQFTYPHFPRKVYFRAKITNLQSQAIKSISIVGGGNVASHLAKALHDAKLPLKQVLMRNLTKSTFFKDDLNLQVIDDPAKLLPVDLLILAVTDDSLVEVAKWIEPNESILAHVSGTIPADLLKEYSTHCAVFYPLQTFSGGRDVDFKQVPIFIQSANQADLEKLQTMAGRLSEIVVVATDEMRQNLHLAAVYVSNFNNALNGIADELLAKAGISFDYLKPLIVETAAKACDLDPVLGQTGPARRNDQSTLALHRRLLTDEKEKLLVYNTITEYILKKYHTE